MKITVLDGFALNPGDLSWEGFENLGDLTVYQRTSPDEVLQRSKDSEILITNKTVLDADTIKALPKLKYIGVLATGYNVVDIDAAAERGIVVTNIPAYSTMSVAQHVFAMLLAVTDRTEYYAEEVKKGRWTAGPDFCFLDTELIELSGKKIGIIGFGNIGKAVARIALAFGMDVVAYTSKEQSKLPNEVTKVSLDALFKDSDVISLHCPLTDTTRHLINTETIGKMKPGVIIINTGRGPLVDEQAVAKALHEGKIKAFCADVLSTEPPAADNPLLKAPRTFITPHIAWATKEARTRLMQIAVENLEKFLKGRPTNVVSKDKPVMSNENTASGHNPRPMYEERRWGEYTVIHHRKFPDNFETLTKQLIVNAGCGISYQRHGCRNEVWTVIDGEGEVVLNDKRQNVKRGDVINIAQGVLHGLRALTSMIIIEVQHGSNLVEDDIERFPYDW